MLRYRAIGFLICLSHFAVAAAGQGQYSIIAPNTIRPNSQYHVAVSIHKSAEPATVKLGLLGSSYSDFKIVEVRPFSSTLVPFAIPSLKRDRYSLTAEGLGGVVFTNETQLNFVVKQFTILVQSDKAIYRPGDTVRYRVLLLDPNLKPARHIGSVKVEIKDAGQNIISSLLDVRLTNAVFANELQLSDSLKLGQWSIVVDVMDQRETYTFEVLEYILPKFEVAIETSKHTIYKDGRITATVKANYAFGKPIIGETTLSIYPTFFGSLQPFVNDLITRKVMPINGAAFFEFDIKNELRLKEDYEREYLLDALVEETSTGSVQNFSTVITVYLDPYRVETVMLPSYYLPGVPFEVTAKVVRNDDGPMKDFSPQISAYLTNVYGSSEMYNKTVYSLDAKGEFKMKFTVPLGDQDEYHSCIVEYLGIVTDLGRVPRKHLLSKNYIAAKVLTDKPTLNQEVSIAVRANEPMKYFMYQVVGRGDILLSRSVEVADSTSHTFKFPATFQMLPRASLLVYVVINGEFVYDEQIIKFEENLLNTVQIEAPSVAAPGQDVDITITTKPYSYVGLMIVDQTAPRLRNGNDLSYPTLMQALGQYELRDEDSPLGKLSGVITMSNTAFTMEKELIDLTPLPGDVEDDKLTTIRKTDIGPAHKIEVNTRAPGKGPYAFSYTPKPFWHNPRIYVMRAPADTWLFSNISAGSDGRTTVHPRLPNDMASWALSAFALDPVTGLGLARPTHLLQSYKEFYITTELPYSIRLGEVIALPFVVFNNKDSELDVDVTLYNTAQEFDFLRLDKKAQATRKIELYMRRSIRVLARSSKSISFIVTPRKVGAVGVKAVASTQLAGDTVESTLLVEHPGATDAVHRGFLLDLSASSQVKKNVSINVPRNAIIDSTKIEVSVVGDIVGSVLTNAERLIHLPTGCGEQAMVNFLPIVLVLNYLQRIRQLSPAVEKRAKQQLQLGYQRLLYYRHPNGAFSAFAISERNSSTWLTAYVARAFRLAALHTEVDENVIRTALAYVASMQRLDGGFEESGDVFEHFGDRGLSLTAFVALALMENVDLYGEYKNHIYKAVDFIARGLDSTSDAHAMAIGTYVLSLANHNAKVAFVQRLDAMSMNEDGRKWWKKMEATSEAPSPWYNDTRTTNIETSAYASLALLQNNLIVDALPVLKWLVDQRSEFGGFASSQDTVVGVQALVAFAERFSSQANNMQVVFHYGEGAETLTNVNEQNSLALQSYELPSSVKNITITATGRGIALAQVSYKYNTNVTSAWPRFVLDPTVNRNSHPDYLHLSACASFVPVEGETNRSNMAVMEVYLPSGFVVNTDTLPTLESSERIKKVETQRRNTVVVIYFDYLDRREVCPTLHAFKTIKVTKHQLVPVVMYDYYDNARRARMFYRAPKSNTCDICEDASCDAFCEKAEKRESHQHESGAMKGQPSVLRAVLVAVFVGFIWQSTIG